MATGTVEMYHALKSFNLVIVNLTMAVQRYLKRRKDQGRIEKEKEEEGGATRGKGGSERETVKSSFV